MNSQLLSVDIFIIEEEKCINLLYSFQNLWDSLIVAIEINNTTLNHDYVEEYLLFKNLR